MQLFKPKYNCFCVTGAITFMLMFNWSAQARVDTKTLPIKSTSHSSSNSSKTPKPASQPKDRRTDVTGLHKDSTQVATLQLYGKVETLRADPLLSALLKSAPSSDSPYSVQNIEAEKAAQSNLDVAENLAASLIRQDKFDAEHLAGMERDCIVLGPKSHQNIVDLSQGNALFAPAKNIVVLTDLGEISIAAGSIVCVLKPEPGMVSVYDLHDQGEKRVAIKTADESLTLAPGKQIILSNKTKEELEFEKITPAHRIAYRNLEHRVLPSGTKVYASEFSIPSAILYLKPLRQVLLSDNKEDRKLADHLLKNFVILEDVLGNDSEPYKMPRPQGLTRISANVK